MGEERIEYDPDAKLIKVYRSFPDPKTLVPKEELGRWREVVEEGKDQDGRPVETVRYVFEDIETAKYNHQPIAFAGLETFIASDGDEESIGDDPEFSVREDFGIDD